VQGIPVATAGSEKRFEGSLVDICMYLARYKNANFKDPLPVSAFQYTTSNSKILEGKGKNNYLLLKVKS
jgi:hypothetical protein